MDTTTLHARRPAPFRLAAIFVTLAALLAITVAGASPAAADTKVAVNIMLQGHTNAALDLRNGEVSYYSNGWHKVTDTNPNNKSIARVNLDPGTYSFAVVYNGTRNQQQVTVDTDGQTVHFHSALVNMDLRDSKGQPLDGAASYYAGGWHTIDGNTGVEMLPGTYSFAAVYNGTRQQKSYTVLPRNPNNQANQKQNVAFKTTLVTVQAQGSSPSPGSPQDIPANGSASYYADGWHEITTLNPNNKRMVQAQMLPGTYSFALTHNGTRHQQSQAVSETGPKTVYFQTASVKVSLTVNGEPVDAAEVTSSYYANGWKDLPATGRQLLPGTYTFAVVHDGVRSQQSYTVLPRNSNNNANGTQTVAFSR